MGESPKDLVRTLSVCQAVALAASLVIGSGVLGLPGIVLEEVAPRYAALAWVATAAAMVPFIVIFAALGSHFPSSPGLLSYAESAYGKAGRKAASLLLFSNIVIGFPALVLIGGSFLQALVGADPKTVPAFGTAILILAVAFNLLGLRLTAGFNALGLIILSSFIVLVTLSRSDLFLAGMKLLPISIVGIADDGRAALVSVWKGAALIFWAFLGWENLGFGVQEIKNPRRAVPLVFGWSFVLVTMLFLMPALTCIGAAAQGRRSVLGAAGIMSLVDGSVLRPLCSLVLVLLIIGNANAWMYTVSRLLFAEATDGILPRSLGRLSDGGVPVRCLLLCLAVVLTSISVCWLAGMKISNLILLVNQNCLFLFLVSIRTYAALATSWIRWVVVPTALVTCSLALSGFSVWILYPISLIVLGCALQAIGTSNRQRTQNGAERAH